MSEILLLKIGSDGLPLEMDTTNDSVTLASFSVQGGGPVMSATGLDLNNLDVADVKDLEFNDPATGTIGATVPIIVNDLMAVDRINTMAVDASILFPTVTDDAGELSAIRLPIIAGVPTATPTAGEGAVVFDSTNNDLYIWNGTAWDNQSIVNVANSLDNIFTSDGAIAIRDVVYISAADKVKVAQGDAVATSAAIGFALAGVADALPVSVRSSGIVTGFTGLTAAAKYYLSAATAGAITTAVPTGAGNVIVQVGYAKSATAMFVDVQQLARRA